jgi:uncharacterized protein (DUF2267 family)
MISPFNKYTVQSNQFLSLLADVMYMPHDKKRVLNILRAVLHAIRNRITPEESAQFMAQLPMLIKAIYVDGWQIGKHQKRIYTFEEFVDEVYDLGGSYTGVAFGDRMEAERGIKSVFKVLKNYISDGEFNDVLATMPAKLRSELLDLLMSNGGLVL